MNDDQALIALADAMGAPGLTPEQARIFAERVGPTFLNRVLMRAEEKLSEEDQKLAAQFIQNEDMEGLLAFLRERVPDFPSLLAGIFNGDAKDTAD